MSMGRAPGCAVCVPEHPNEALALSHPPLEPGVIT